MICNLCSSFLGLCIFNYEQLCSKRLGGMDWIDPNRLVDDFPHQPNYETLCTSAQNDCHLCVFLRLVIERGNARDTTRYVVDADKALLPIKLSQRRHGDWYY